MLVYLCGCSQKVADNTENQVIFKDALNCQVSIGKKPKRVAALIGSFAEIWQLAGGEVCATSEDAWEDFNLELENCVNIGGAHSPGLEALLSANPELVIASASTASNVKMKNSLESAGITVVYFDVDSFEDYLFMLDVCTDITGRKDLYEKNGVEIKNRIEGIRKEFFNAELSEEKKKILVLRASSGAVKAKGSKGTVLGEMLEDLGCVNIADSDKNLLETLSVESVIKQNPYRIFVVAMGNEEAAMKSLSLIMKENPAWGTLSAVKENRLHIMERKLFNLKPNRNWAESYEKLSGILLSE